MPTFDQCVNHLVEIAKSGVPTADALTQMKREIDTNLAWLYDPNGKTGERNRIRTAFANKAPNNELTIQMLKELDDNRE
jgi:hypothetical protein